MVFVSNGSLLSVPYRTEAIYLIRLISVVVAITDNFLGLTGTQNEIFVTEGMGE